MITWLSMDTAPHDGTRILVKSAERPIVIAEWGWEGIPDWFVADDGHADGPSGINKPLGWMHLPAP